MFCIAGHRHAMLVQLFKDCSGGQDRCSLGTLYCGHTYAVLAAMQPSKDCLPARAAFAALQIRAAV